LTNKSISGRDHTASAIPGPCISGRKLCFHAGTDVTFVAPSITQAAEDHYRVCVFAAADKRCDVPACAEDIVAAAEEECRPDYLAYADLVEAQSSSAAHTRAKNQLENDKAEAQLLAVQLNMRQLMMDRIGCGA
jgi:hypothetical protein